MIALWFALLAFTLILFVVLDGWNIGTGVLHLALARTEDERRRVIAALGPLWSWHEVWLVARAACSSWRFRARWPPALPASTWRCGSVSGRSSCAGSPLEVGAPSRRPALGIGLATRLRRGQLPAGAALRLAPRQLVRGVPIGASGTLSAWRSFTSFRLCARRWAISTGTRSQRSGLFAIVLLAGHGAVYRARARPGHLNQRGRDASRMGVDRGRPALLPVVTSETVDQCRGALRRNRPRGRSPGIAPIGPIAGRRSSQLSQRACAPPPTRERWPVFGHRSGPARQRGRRRLPDMLHSTLAPEYSLTRAAAATLARPVVAILWWPAAAALAFTYAAIVARRSHGRSDARPQLRTARRRRRRSPVPRFSSRTPFLDLRQVADDHPHDL
jgi:cytochrome d ubiquinol oxidase subunit II